MIKKSVTENRIGLVDKFCIDYLILKDIKTNEYILSLFYRHDENYRYSIYRGGWHIKIDGKIYLVVPYEENVKITLELENIQDQSSIIHYDPQLDAFTGNSEHYKFIRPRKQHPIFGKYLIAKPIL